MLTRPQRQTAVRLALIATAAVAVTACSSRPKPSFPTAKPPSSEVPVTRPPANNGVTSTPLPSGAVPGSAQDFVVNVGDTVLFDFDMYEIRSDAQPILDSQAAWLRRYPQVRVRIEGNTDELGTAEYNLALGARRASAVRDYLVSRGVTSDRIATMSYGKERPVDPGSSDEAHARNRNAKTAIVSGAR
jgi:peptidoglycan-associated lipoprotein